MSNDIGQYGKKQPEELAESEHKRLRWRSGLLIFFFLLALSAYVYTLYDLQIVHGVIWREEAAHNNVRLSTVDSVRGDILDVNGRVLITNTQSYQVTLDPSLMGGRQVEILSALLDICRQEEVEWSDSFPVSRTAPWSFTRADVFTYFYTKSTTDDWGTVTESRERRRTNLGALAVRRGWMDDPLAEEWKSGAVIWLSAGELMGKMCEDFGIELPESGEITSEVRDLLGVLYELTLRQMEITYTNYTFATSNIGISFISKVKERSLTGVSVSSATSRQYNTTYAAHVLGRVGAIDYDEKDDYLALGYPLDARVGKQGAEKAFESWLRGTSGTLQTTTSDSGKVVDEKWVVDEATGRELSPVPGANVTLTLDIGLQAAVEDALAAHIQSVGAEKGAVAVVDMTGGALALASYPTYDLSTYAQNVTALGEDPLKPLLNRATNGTYSPGSTFKPMTAVAGLMEGVITPTDVITCRGAYTYEYWKDFTAYCLRRSGHGNETLTKALKDSCNVYFYDVGRRVGITKLNEYAAQFGLGQHTGIEIGDAAGYVAGPATSEHFNQIWYEGNTAYAAIGQENNMITPLQLANYIATLVNGGNHYAVHLLDSVKSHDYSTVLYEYEPELLNTIDIPAKGLAAIKEGMYQVTQNGVPARYFKQLSIKAGAKTGTAEVTGGTQEKNTNGLLVVFAPLDNPQIAMCILLEGANAGGPLSSVACEILDYYFSRDALLTQLPAENELIR